jgi:hypothetical protein
MNTIFYAKPADVTFFLNIKKPRRLHGGVKTVSAWGK